MTHTIRVYIGDGSHLDGGPFDNVRVMDHDETTFMGVSGSHRGDYQHGLVNELATEINGYGPGRITGVPKAECFMFVDIECHDGVLFETDGMVASGEELAASGDLRRQFTNGFKHHGGEVSENY